MGKAKTMGALALTALMGMGEARSDEWDCRGSYTGFISK